MKGFWMRAFVTATALGLVAGAIALAATATTNAPSRPVRALGANDAGPAGIAQGAGGASVEPVAGSVAAPHLTESLSSLTTGAPTRVPWVKKELRLEADEEFAPEEARPALGTAASSDQADEVLQTERGSLKIPKPDFNVPGLGSAANPYKLVPPDTNGDVGGGYFLQMVNVTLAIFDADTGAKLDGPRFMSDLFDVGSQKLCATHDDGDPVVVYDEFAGVWVISQFALNFNQPRFSECIAVSQTSNPMGAWNAYQFDYPNPNVLNDYPKFGVWPATNNSAYFASFNQFRCSSSVCDFAWRGAGAVAYERDAMIAGDPAGQVYVDLYPVDPNLGAQLPSDADGVTAPAANAPNAFMQFDADEWGYADDQLELWEFTADFTTPEDSTFDGPTYIPTANFNPWVCGAGRVVCIPQKGTKNKLDAVNDRLMFRLQYRRAGGIEHLVVTHSVRASKGKAGLRWYQLDDSGSGWSIANQGTYKPNAKSRWMGSAAMDAAGNIAAGYSVSSKRIFPSIAIAGRTAGAPANTFDLSERKVFAGTGSERGKFSRWGDYSDMTVAEDGCTFYYTQQYYKRTGQYKWATRIVRFQIDAGACIP
ncbi:MAG: hypothetical protein OEV60_02165 [Actinomycetota bacterium]|nr:hypothetical protein [Actinomycetota bacterium]MDH5224567.1 hypothetical protein [Actinomycetota bacterium]MDH5312834.1 hypothetical protein [Actinomycetota bacterium]